jgi:hypothetical protein
MSRAVLESDHVSLAILRHLPKHFREFVVSELGSENIMDIINDLSILVSEEIRSPHPSALLNPPAHHEYLPEHYYIHFVDPERPDYPPRNHYIPSKGLTLFVKIPNEVRVSTFYCWPWASVGALRSYIEGCLKINIDSIVWGTHTTLEKGKSLWHYGIPTNTTLAVHVHGCGGGKTTKQVGRKRRGKGPAAEITGS